MTDRNNTPRRPRSSVLLTGETRIGGRSEKVRIRNLSETGAMIESTSVSPAVGAPGTLIRDGKEMPYVVIWRQTFRYGIEFARPVDEQDLLPGKAIGSPSREKTARFRRPGLRENAR